MFGIIDDDDDDDDDDFEDKFVVSLFFPKLLPSNN